MTKIAKLKKTIALAAACLTLTASFTGCDNDIEYNINNEISSDTLTADTDIPAETSSPAQNEPSVSQKAENSAMYDSNAASCENSEFNGKFSYLVINNCSFPHYSVEDGYYTINFLADSDFQDRVNNDIKEAMQKISRSYDNGYLAETNGPLYPYNWSAIINSYCNGDELEMANGIAIEIICQNGYLSIALGYLDSEGYIAPEEGQFRDYKHERYWDVVETLNYDIINNKKIEKFSELLCGGADASAVLNDAVSYYDNDRIKTPDTDPEHFTIYYTLQDSNGEYSNDYSTLQYFSREAEADYKNLSLLKPACYRDMSSKIESSIESEQLFDEKTSDAYEVVEEDGIYYSRLKASVGMTADEINEYNKKIIVIQHKGVDTYGFAYDFVQRNPEESLSKTLYYSVQASKSEYLKNVCTITGLRKEEVQFYDLDTAEEITIEALIGSDWMDYLTDGTCSSDSGSCTLSYYVTDWEEKTLEIHCYEQDNTFILTVPADKINQRYALITD